MGEAWAFSRRCCPMGGKTIRPCQLQGCGWSRGPPSHAPFKLAARGESSAVGTLCPVVITTQWGPQEGGALKFIFSTPVALTTRLAGNQEHLGVLEMGRGPPRSLIGLSTSMGPV